MPAVRISLGAYLSFPFFDLAAFERADAETKAAQGRELDHICRTTGFLAVMNHGVPQATVQAVWDAARAFFDLSGEEKQKSRALYPGYPYGYIGPELESLARSRNVDAPADLKESFNGGPRNAPEGMTDPEALAFCYAKTIWPERPAGFRAAWQGYYAAMEDLAWRIMRAFAVALRLDENFFAPYLGAPISALRALNYPEQSNAPKPGQIRAGAHTDYGSLTILLPEAGSKGLEILTPDGAWTPVPPEPGAFVVNIGDLMARWTNDRWVSTLHRVVNPKLESEANRRRQSLAFFHQPNWDAEIVALPSCLTPDESAKYEPVLSGPYLMSKFKSTTT
jgi:isopenicillin N synthase-like dioxygenase